MVTIKYKECFNLDHFEHNAWAQDRLVIGIDEAGRGCLAGPVVCAAVALFKGKTSPLVKDSKKLTPSQRQEAYAWISQNSIFSYAIIDNHLIDKHNIYQATLRGMERALAHTLAKLRETPETVLVDAMPLMPKSKIYAELPIYYFNYGEDKSSSIAAASIIAKVTRDKIMEDLDLVFPAFQLKNNKGYGTPSHKNALSNHLHSSIHRQFFID